MKQYLKFRDCDRVLRTVGYIETESKTFYSPREPKNLLRKKNGFALSKRIIGYLNEQGVETVCISYCGSLYSAPTLAFCNSGIRVFDIGDEQKVLRINEFDVERQFSINDINYGGEE